MRLNFRTLASFVATLTIFDVTRAGAQTEHLRYRLVDMGTFGGPQSGVNDGPPPVSQVLNDRGTIVGSADTATPDPFSPDCLSECFVEHAFEWRDGRRTDLGTLAGVNNSSVSVAVNRRGLIVGASNNSSRDPDTGLPEINGVVWEHSHIVNLGTFGGTQSLALGLNDRDQVVGGALNTIPDPFESAFASLAFVFPGTTQMHAFLWEKGDLQDLGTLGGPDSEAFFVNDRGQIAGISYTTSTPNTTTGVPTEDPFLWIPCDRERKDGDERYSDAAGEKGRGRMLDLGSLGGTFGIPSALTKNGQAAGVSNLKGDKTRHPFLWTAPGPMRDLGTLGGDNGVAFWANDKGEVVGYSDLPGSQVSHAFLWRRGVMTDLGTVDGDPCSMALSINSKGQVVGTSTACGERLHGFISEHGGPSIDLNTLIRPDPSLTIREGDFINERGEIAGKALLSNGNVHAILLIPCDNDGGADKACD